MRVLGVDPGITNTGFGLVVEESGRMKAVHHGSIKTRSGDNMSHRLNILYKRLVEVISELSPDTVVIEELFFNTNLKTAVAVGQARGVILLACEHSNVSWAQYTPLQVKQAVAGNGNATKDQVQYMVEALLGMKDASMSSHAADALAMAICHLQSMRFREMTGS
ncbi:MAG: crossover junction endodeoxyribonuclease RuvC [Actinobacteria bacterium]|nr:crossover junction endodeoxyribonuclease RuvC [Actinomycetota bacterium]